LDEAGRYWIHVPWQPLDDPALVMVLALGVRGSRLILDVDS
jgi:hypothetical protein